MSELKTADLSDRYGDRVQVCEPIFRDFGGRLAFHGRIATVKCFEDNSLVREWVSRPGEGRVLVVDAGGSLRCAMLGDTLAQKAADNGWSGVVLFGCVRDCAKIAGMTIGVKALASHPMKSVKRGVGEDQVAVRFAGVAFRPGEYLYADLDGILVSAEALTA